MNAQQDQALEKLFSLLDQDAQLQERLAGFSAQDWADVEEAARVQGLNLLLYARLNHPRTIELVPASVWEKLQETHLQVSARNTLMLHHAGVVLSTLAGQGLDVIALKGLYLAEAVYGDIGLRRFDDIDLLLRRRDLPAALKVMRGLGYELSSWYDPADANRDLKHVPPLEKKHAPTIELHWTILEEEEPFNIDVEGLWARSIHATVAGVDVRALSVEDLLLHLSLHLTYQHRLRAGARNLYDIDAVIRSKQIDWQCLVNTAQEWDADRVTWLTLRLLQEIAHTPLPEDVLERLKPERPDAQIVASAKALLLRCKSGGMPLTPDLAALAEQRGVFGRLRLAASRVFIPRRVMAREYNVDPRSLKIYWFYLMRLARLARTYRGSAARLLSGEESAAEEARFERERGEMHKWLGGEIIPPGYGGFHERNDIYCTKK